MQEFTSKRAGGEPMELAPVRFKLDGQEFSAMEEVTGDSLLEWSELGIAASEEVDIDSPEGVAYLARFLRAAFAPGEYQRFRRHVRAHKTPPETVMAVVAAIQQEMATAVEAATDRPTEPSSPSSSGDEDQGGQRARVISLDKGLVEWVDDPARVEAMRQRAAEQDRADAEEAESKPKGKRKAAGGGVA